MIQVAINGYGRIGRNVHRQFLERFSDEVKVVGINASSTAEMRAYLLKYDSLHGAIDEDIHVVDDNTISVNGSNVRVVKEKDPSKCPWKELGVDIVVESSGHFTTYDSAKAHIDAGAKRVIVTAPMKDDTPTFVLGVNDEGITAELEIVSNASCTTNCIAPVMKIIDDNFKIEHLLVNSVHAYTATQKLLDNKASGSDLRKARAATLSMIPTKTGAVKACGDIFPHLKGKMDGMAFRVPVPTVSCSYMAFTVNKPTTREEVIEKMHQAASSERMKGILNVSAEPLVSIDYMTNPNSSIVDEEFTKVIDGTALQILSWYDNEWGYAMRVTEMTIRIASML